MSSTFSANKSYELQATGDNNGTWGVKLDAVISTLDLNFGGRKNTVLSNANVTVSAADAQNVRHVLTGTLTANITYTFPAGGSFYWVTNATTGAFTVTIASAAAGTSYVLPQGATVALFLNPDNNNVELLSPPSGGNQLTVVNVAGNSNVTLTVTQSQQPVIEFIGALTGNINVIFPTASNPAGGNWIISNETTGNFTITCKTSGGTGVIVAQGKNSLIWSDGTNIQYSFNDVSTVQGYVSANKAGDTITGALIVQGALTAQSTLGVTGTSTLGALNAGATTGTTIVASTYLQSAPASGAAPIYMTCSGHHQWELFSNTDNAFYIADNTGGFNALVIDSANHATFFGNLTCNGAFNTNGISGTTGFFSSTVQANGQINSQNSMIVQTPPGVGAWYYGLINGVREWQWGVQNDATFWIYDSSAGAARLVIDTAGTVTVEQFLLVGGNHQVNGNSSFFGSISCNTISCSTINMNGNTLTTGQINSSGNLATNQINAGNLFVAGISCTTLNTNGNQLNCGILSASSNVHTGNFGIVYDNYSSVILAMKWTGSATNMRLMANNGDQGSFFINNSDARIKENIAAPEGDALSDLKTLKLHSFDFNEEHGGKHFGYGFIAQEVEEMLPEAVTGNGKDEIMGINPLPLLARCVSAIQKMSARIEELEAKLAAMEAVK